jgi:hypothetical protein
MVGDGGGGEQSDVPDALVVAEYQSLRAEILQAQQTRALLLGFSLAATGTLSGLALGYGNRGGDCNLLVPGVVAFALVLIAVAANFTAVLTQRIDLLSGYIRRDIEGRYRERPMWETVWTAVRRRRSSDVDWVGRLPMGTSKAYAFYYGVLTLGTLGEYFLANGWRCLARLPIVVVPLLVALYVCGDLHERWRRSWVNPLEGDPSSVPVPRSNQEREATALLRVLQGEWAIELGAAIRLRMLTRLMHKSRRHPKESNHGERGQGPK